MTGPATELKRESVEDGGDGGDGGTDAPDEAL
jgi:hypothetical protein